MLVLKIDIKARLCLKRSAPYHRVGNRSHFWDFGPAAAENAIGCDRTAFQPLRLNILKTSEASHGGSGGNPPERKPKESRIPGGFPPDPPWLASLVYVPFTRTRNR